MIEHLRVLDLTDERGLLCGRLLADLGADVVQVEPRGGSSARHATPVAQGEPGPSFFWETFAAGKRGIELDLDSADGLATFHRLADAADVVVTSYPPAQLVDRGLNPETLLAAHPHLVCVAITPFGLTGPKAEYADSDLVVWAAGGPLQPHCDGARPPLRIGVPQAFLHAGADAAAGALTALRGRARTGRGQVVDVSAQVSVGAATLARVLAAAVGDDRPEWHQQPGTRSDQSGSGAATPHSLKKWQCADGMVELHLSMGPAAGGFTNNLFRWLSDEGAVSERIAAWDWREVPDRLLSGELSNEDLDEARAAVRAFLLTRTKADVVAAALDRRLLCMAIYDMGDVLASPHLAERGYWGEIEVNGCQVRVPGVFAQVTDADGPTVRGSAPALDEHGPEVLRDWLGSDNRAVPDSRARGAAPGAAARRVPSTAEPAPDALTGLRVLDLSWVVAGPLISRALADFGADVVRVESSTRVETARLMQPFHGGVQDKENSALFGHCNAGKRGITVDLKSDEGRQVVKDLVNWADVVVESFSPGQLAKWGLDYATLSQDRPDLVMLSTCIAGQTGPWSRLAGFGNVGSSLSGFQNLVGWADGLPLGPFGPYTDYIGPRLGLTALLAALERRDRTGRGCYLDVAQVEAGVFFLSPQLAHAAYDGTIAQRRGNADEQLAPHAVHPCLPNGAEPRFVAIVARSDEEWRNLAAVVGRPDLAARPDLATAAGRRAASHEIEEAITAWSEHHTAAQAEHALQGAGVPAHVAASSADFWADPQLRHRGHVVALPSERHGTTYVEGPRFQLSEQPGRPRRAAPSLGQDNETVLRELLAYDEERVAALIEKGVMR